MVSLNIQAAFNSDVSQSLKEVEGLRNDAEELEGRIDTLKESGYDVNVTMNNGELELDVVEGK